MSKLQDMTYEEATLLLLLKKYPMLKNYNVQLQRMIQMKHMRGGIGEDVEQKAKYVQPPQRTVGKLKLGANFLSALEEAIATQAAQALNKPLMPPPKTFRPLETFDAPIAPPLFMNSPPQAPPLVMPREARVFEEGQQFQSYKPLAQRNLLEELKDYKDGLEYVRSICPMLKRTYVKKEVKQPMYSQKVLKAMEKMRKADLKYLN